MSRQRANRRVAVMSLAIIGGMLGLTAASVPLYRLFCQVTGYGGTTQRADAAGESVEQQIRVRFNANVAGDLPWDFGPQQRIMTVKLGESEMAYYKAYNRSDRPVVGMATFNVTPHTAGVYFSKIHCFCFDEQTLQPGQSVDMPVNFFVDPAIKDDLDTAGLEEITLSYTFFIDKEATERLSRPGAQAAVAVPEPVVTSPPQGG